VHRYEDAVGIQTAGGELLGVLGMVDVAIRQPEMDAGDSMPSADSHSATALPAPPAMRSPRP
jgi:hypothetical protein